ncbi:hypothetical protein [Sphaerisporangium aureirubrum]|uniref:Uncharacterized protein n=1 Tax=Sphaerisporangium aureirubrum TaxID=1544736 RepID=A0ABW1NGA4_9ACTN
MQFPARGHSGTGAMVRPGHPARLGLPCPGTGAKPPSHLGLVRSGTGANPLAHLGLVRSGTGANPLAHLGLVYSGTGANPLAYLGLLRSGTGGYAPAYLGVRFGAGVYALVYGGHSRSSDGANALTHSSSPVSR